MGPGRGVADVRQLHLPGPALPAPPDAGAGGVLPLLEPGREHAQGAGAPLGAGGAGGRFEEGRAHRAERRARFDCRTTALPAAHGKAGGRRVGGVAAAYGSAPAGWAGPWWTMRRSRVAGPSDMPISARR